MDLRIIRQIMTFTVAVKVKITLHYVIKYM